VLLMHVCYVLMSENAEKTNYFKNAGPQKRKPEFKRPHLRATRAIDVVTSAPDIHILIGSFC
jgi:hypothetical protein